jgi:hypothetical protein
MSLAARLLKAESTLADNTLWLEAQKLATRIGEDPSELFEQARAVLADYGHLLAPGADGKVDLDSALRAMAKKESFDYHELARLARRYPRQFRGVTRSHK